MTLRARTLAIVGMTMAALFVALFFFARTFLTSRFDALEQKSAAQDSRRVTTALADELRQLRRVAGDWAPQQDTYDFMTGRSEDYLSRHLSVESLVNLDANVVLFVAQDGGLKHAEYLDLDLGTRTTADGASTAALLKAKNVRSPEDPRAHVSGIFSGPSGPMLVAAQSITTNDLYGPPAGTLVLARYFDKAEVERLAHATGLNVEAFPLPGKMSSALTSVLEELERTHSVATRPVSEDRLATYALVKDLGGKPALLVRTEVPRSIHRQGQNSILFLAFAMFVIGIAAIGSVFTVVDRVVLRRVSRLSRQLASIAVRRDSSRRVSVTGRDELASLAEDVNHTLASMEAAQMAVEHARDQLEHRVRERTEELRASESRYRLLVERMADAVISVDLDGAITYANDRAEDLTGRGAQELVGMRFEELLTPASAEEVSRRSASGMEPGATFSMEVQVVHAVEGPMPAELRAAPTIDESGRISGLQWIAHDITQRKRYEEELVRLANHDYLTGLFNRRFFEEALELRLAEARRSGGRGAVLWLDVDDFKDVNDSLGHRAGDEILLALSEQLRAQVRDYNVLARLGGDEFGVLVPDVSPEEAEAAADRILSSINSQTYTADEHAIRISASMGVVVYPEHGMTVEELLAKADVAMYYAKESGRSRVHVHQIDDSGHEELRSRVRWNERIVQALWDEQFLVYAQPVLDLRTKRVVRHELLIRMLDETGEVISPVEFLPAAERLGLINDIDRWMIRQAVELLRLHRDDGLELEVNLSGKALGDHGLLRAIEGNLQDAGVEPNRLGLEITETAAVADISRAQSFIFTLKDLGCRFSLDDFGSGFSSFYYLKHLPIDCLKVDGSFIRGIAHSHQDKHLVRGMVELCRGLGIEVAAEYVENAETLGVIESLGVDYAQGYEIGRPVPVTEAIQTLLSSSSKGPSVA